MLTWLTNGRRRKERAQALYLAISAQARQPAFYADAGVPDTITGRFEMLVVHLFLVLDRLRRCGSHGEEAAQILAETFITDMDDVMREMGIGDLSVARKMFQTAGAYMGRLKAYDDALEDPEPEVLVQALLRNVYADARPSEATLFARALAAYVRTSRDHLERQPTEDLLSGRVTFMQPDVAPAIAS